LADVGCQQIDGKDREKYFELGTVIGNGDDVWFFFPKQIPKEEPEGNYDWIMKIDEIDLNVIANSEVWQEFISQENPKGLRFSKRPDRPVHASEDMVQLRTGSIPREEADNVNKPYFWRKATYMSNVSPVFYSVFLPWYLSQPEETQLQFKFYWYNYFMNPCGNCCRETTDDITKWISIPREEVIDILTC
jgi:hypothetical protein